MKKFVYIMMVSLLICLTFGLSGCKEKSSPQTPTVRRELTQEEWTTVFQLESYDNLTFTAKDIYGEMTLKSTTIKYAKKGELAHMIYEYRHENNVPYVQGETIFSKEGDNYYNYIDEGEGWQKRDSYANNWGGFEDLLEDFLDICSNYLLPRYDIVFSAEQQAYIGTPKPNSDLDSLYTGTVILQFENGRFAYFSLESSVVTGIRTFSDYETTIVTLPSEYTVI